MSTTGVDTGRLRAFIGRFTRLVDEAARLAPAAAEERIFEAGIPMLGELVSHDDWLPPELARPDPERYQQHLVHCDPLERWSMVSFVWGPGQKTPVHDHTVWGLIGMLRGEELCEEFAATPQGSLVPGTRHRLVPGEVDRVSPTVGDVHRVSNALETGPSISIHLYGGNIGTVRRHVFDARTGEARPFVSGYSNRTLPNIWGLGETG